MPLSETRMIARAIMQRWPIKAEYRAGLITKLMQVIANPKSSAREVTAAAKAIMAAEAQNQADEHKVLDIGNQHNRDRLIALAGRLGVDPLSIADETVVEGGDPSSDGEQSGDGEADDATGA